MIHKISKPIKDRPVTNPDDMKDETTGWALCYEDSPMENEYEESPCDLCEGTGDVYINLNDEYIVKPCPHCNGLGVVRRVVKYGRKMDLVGE